MNQNSSEFNRYEDNKALLNIQNFITSNQIEVQTSTNKIISKNLIPIELRANNNLYIVHIDDEYDDLMFNNNLLNAILVFRELANINDSLDFLEWCKTHRLDPNSSMLLNYYQHICKKIENISSLFPENTIDYFISDLDFQLNSGAIQLLRK